MSTGDYRSLSNKFQDVRLLSLTSWSRASEINPRDARGPYVVLQEGYDPADLAVTPDEFILGRSGKWLSLGLFYRLPVKERRGEFVFGMVAEVIGVLSGLPSKAVVLKLDARSIQAGPESAEDDLARAVRSRSGEEHVP